MAITKKLLSNISYASSSYFVSKQDSDVFNLTRHLKKRLNFFSNLKVSILEYSNIYTSRDYMFKFL